MATALPERRPFRFIAPMPTLAQSPSRWRDTVRWLEATGYATVAISDHVTHGWAMDPLVTMMAAADATDQMRVLSLVLSNDYRHPALVHKAIGTIDVLSGGRAELGLGAGWMAADYDAIGLSFGTPGARIARLEESVRLVKRLFASEGPVSVSGSHYRIHELDGLPVPVQRPRPPILIGGGGRSILSLAGREADIVGVNASLPPGADRTSGVVGLTAAAAREKLGWVWAAATGAGRTPAELEFQVSVLEVHVTDSRADASRVLDSLSDDLGLVRDTVESAPTVLVGSVARCCELLEERRETFGFSYIKLSPATAASARLVARLAGR